MAPSTESPRSRHLDIELTDGTRVLRSALGAACGAAPVHWDQEMAAAARQLVSEFHQHVDATEGPDGIYREALMTEPRLASRVRRLLCEHAELARGIAELSALAESCNAPPERADPPAARGPEPLRRSAERLLAALARHRRHSAELMYELYVRDLGISGSG